MARLTPARLGLAVAVVLALAILGAGVLLAPTERVLVVEDVETGETLLEQRVENGTTVALEYTHSVEKSRVYDGYTVRSDELVMTRMEFESYGWGLPADADVSRQNGTLVYDPPGAVSDLYVSPGTVAGHELHVGDSTHDLVSLSGGQSVHIHLERRSPFDPLP